MRLLIAPLTYTRAVLGMVFVAVLTIVLSGPTMLFGTLGKERLTTLCMWGWSRLVLIFFWSAPGRARSRKFAGQWWSDFGVQSPEQF